MRASRAARVTGALVFALAAAALFWRLWRLRYEAVWIDESDNVAIGWLLSEGGHRLYDTLFSHHTPLAYLVGHAVALLSPSDDLAHFRLVAPLAYVATGLAFVGAPLAVRSSDRRWLAGALFVAATALLVPVWWGGLLVTDVLWGSAFVVCAASLWLPLCLGLAPGRGRSLLGGAALGLWVSGSLATVYPLVWVALGVAATLAFAPAARAAARAAAGPAAFGVALVGVLQLGWLLGYGDLGGFFEQAIAFNFAFYGPFQGYAAGGEGVLGLWGTGVAATATDWWTALRTLDGRSPETWFAPLVLVASAGLGLRAARSLPFAGRARAVAAVAATLALLGVAASLRLRGPGFHAAPYYLWVLAATTAWLAGLGDRVRDAAFISAFGVLLGLGWSARVPLRFASNTPTLTHALGRIVTTYEYVQEHTTPEQRLLVLNVDPLGYVLARRHPAHRAVFYLPWQAAWERSRPEPDSCAQVRAAPPPFVLYDPHPVHGYSWNRYGACFEALLRERY